VSWGKFLSPEEGGRFAEVHSDATVVWPILIKAVLDSLGLKRKARQARGGKGRR
jgi:deoxyhypusine synthase